MGLGDKLVSTNEGCNDYYHGAILNDSEAILNEGFLFSPWFLNIRTFLMRHNVQKDRIITLLEGIYDLLPIELAQAYHDWELVDRIRVFFERNTDGALYSSLVNEPDIVPTPMSYPSAFHYKHHSVNLTRILGRAQEHIRSKHRHLKYAWGRELMDAEEDGVVFQVRLPFDSEVVSLAGAMNIRLSSTIYVVSRNTGTQARISSLAGDRQVGYLTD